MTMADNDRKWFAELVSDFKKEILNYISRGFSEQEKLFDAKLDPIGKSQDRLRDDIDDLYDKNRDQIAELSELKTDFKNHTDNHNKSGSNIKWIIGIAFMLLFSGGGLIVSIIALGG